MTWYDVNGRFRRNALDAGDRNGSKKRKQMQQSRSASLTWRRGSIAAPFLRFSGRVMGCGWIYRVQLSGGRCDNTAPHPEFNDMSKKLLVGCLAHVQAQPVRQLAACRRPLLVCATGRRLLRPS